MAEIANGCGWEMHSEAEKEYHDKRWCKPVDNERELYAMLCIEGMQAGLSWSLILKREAGIRAAFDDFDFNVTALYDDAKIEALLNDPRIIRNRAKTRAVAQNARAFLAVIEEFGSFLSYIRSFVGSEPTVNHPQNISEITAENELSRTLSADLKKRGFAFVGPKIVYSYLQAIGFINDHVEGCPFKYSQ